MKEEIVRFTCEQCKKEKLISVTMMQGFPYKEGWIYIYEFNGKVKIGEEIKQIKDKDMHFCSKKCLLNYISNKIKLKNG